MSKSLVEKTEELCISKSKGKTKAEKLNNKRKKHLIDVDPEHIAEVRAQRILARQAKRDALIAKGLDPDIPADMQFIKRPMLSVPREPIDEKKVFCFTIMTYNCLAQALIRRKMFPNSGNALKWFKRSQVLLNEFNHYNPDVKCLQEIDFLQYKSFWKPKLEKRGYDCQFHRHPDKNHGVLIAWKRELFQMTDKMVIDYDKEKSGNIEPRTHTKNIAMIISLKFMPKVLENYPGTSKTGLIVGTTHLFWHPFGTFERTRQCYVLLKKMQEFKRRVNILQNNNDYDDSHWFSFFCGDFNAQPFDSPYLSMTSKPVVFEGRAKTVLECSTSYTYSKLRNGEISEEEEEEEEDNDEEKEASGAHDDRQPHTPTPESFEATQDQLELCCSMKCLHNELAMRAISLYSVAYHHVHPENSGTDNDRNEPEMSNWALSWFGLLDYIFFVRSWDGSDKRKVESLKDFETENHIQILELLRLPSIKEMPSHEQPHESEYPSDHLCLMSKVGLSM